MYADLGTVVFHLFVSLSISACFTWSCSVEPVGFSQAETSFDRRLKMMFLRVLSAQGPETKSRCEFFASANDTALGGTDDNGAPEDCVWLGLVTQFGWRSDVKPSHQ